MDWNLVIWKGTCWSISLVGEVDEPLLLMIPSSFISPRKEAPASLSPADPEGLELSSRSREVYKQLHESPRRRRIEDTMRVSLLGTLPEEEWERYQSQLERNGSSLQPSGRHGEGLGGDTKIRDAVRNEGGVESAHYARGSRITDQLHRV